MDKDLCIKLKEAGFPQDYKNGKMIDAEECDVCGYHVCYEPTLEELIEECGDRFDDLKNCTSVYASAKASRNSNGGRVTGGYEASSTEDKEEDYFWEWGASPREAVAKLYLAIKANGK